MDSERTTDFGGRRRSIVVALLVGAVIAAPASADEYGWPRAAESGGSLRERFPAPAGFERVPVEAGTFAAWLRELPLLPPGSPVKSFAGEVLVDRPLGVVDLDVGEKDLQQCADSIIRLRAEYLKSRGNDDDIAFHFTSGDLARWPAYAEGQRPIVPPKGPVRWAKKAKPSHARATFEAYLRLVFGYAGTASLERHTPSVALAEVAAGDFFVVGGFPGHAVMVLDVAVDERGRKQLLLGQGFMPAQSFHVIGTAGGATWHLLDVERGVRVPSWPDPFGPASLRRFEERAP